MDNQSQQNINTTSKWFLKRPNSIQENGYRLRASCLCFKDESLHEILLINSLTKPHHWILPGGGMEAGEEPKDAALRECYEEAGVKGHILDYIGLFLNEETKTNTHVFTLIVDSLWDEYEEGSRGRLRQWFKINEAKDILLVCRPHQLKYFDYLN